MPRINQPICDIKSSKGALDGQPCFILGNGPSIKHKNLRLLEGFFSIGVNRIHKLYDPTILFWQDQNVWRDDSKHIESSRSIKVCAKRAGPKYFYNFDIEEQEKTWLDEEFIFYSPMNSGGNAIQLADYLGCSPIIILGIDCKFGENGETDFYGNNLDYWGKECEWCNRHMSWIKGKLGDKIVNCGEVGLWKKSGLEDTIVKLNSYKKSHEEFVKILSKK